MRKKFQVFVSSTLADLKDERRAVIEAILNQRHIPVGMEAFEAGNDDQWSYIKQRIDEADYYVVIVAERYGSEKDGVSYTEMEYDYAVSKGVPVAAFLLAEDARSGWRANKADQIDNRAKVNDFRAKCQNRLVKYWSNKDDLALACVHTLSLNLTDDLPGGWIPAGDAPSADVANELARLSRENEELREKLKGGDGDREEEEAIANLRKIYVTAGGGEKYYAIEGVIQLHAHLLSGIAIRTSNAIFPAISIKNGKLRVSTSPHPDRSVINLMKPLLLYGIVNKHFTGSNSGDFEYRFTDFGKRVVRRLQHEVTP